MRIVVNCINLQGEPLKSTSFLENFLGFLCIKYTETQFYFLVNKGTDGHLPSSANASIITTDYTINSFVSLKIWSSIKLPMVLRKLNASVLIQPFGLTTIATNIPQILFMYDLTWMQKPALLPPTFRLLHKVFGQKIIQKSAQIVTLSQSLQQQLINQLPELATKTTVIGGAISSMFQPISSEHKQQIKNVYADGRSYFLFIGGNDPSKNVVGVIKAFSSFKRWQKSNMKLLIMGPFTPQKEDMLKKLSSYKYKDDVVVLKNLSKEQTVLITASAFALIVPYLHVTEESAMTLLTSMQCGVPVIASNFEAMTEFGGDSCLYVSPDETDEIANKMKHLYRDEQLQTTLKVNGLQQAALYNWDKTANKFWDMLLKVI